MTCHIRKNGYADCWRLTKLTINQHAVLWQLTHLSSIFFCPFSVAGWRYRQLTLKLKTFQIRYFRKPATPTKQPARSLVWMV